MNEPLIPEGRVLVGEQRIEIGRIAEVIVNFKREGYAAGKKAETLPDGSKSIKLGGGSFYYEDRWSGFDRSNGGGSETLRFGSSETEAPIVWRMNYFGGIEQGLVRDDHLSERIFAFLKKALLNVENGRPFRGPEIPFASEDLFYICRTRGDFSRFSGAEEIFIPNLGMVYSGNINGGLLVPHDN